MEEKSVKSLKDTLWIGIAVIILITFGLLVLVFFLQGGILGVKEWLVPISEFVTLITLAVGSWVAVNNYRLKIETEKRLSDSSRIESNIRLLKLFSEMMQIANSRQPPFLSEKVIEGLFQNKIINADDYKNAESLRMAEMKLNTAILVPAYGAATQDAVIAAIFTLGKEHDVLRKAAIEGLISVKSFHPDTNKQVKKGKYIDELSAI
jgi:hypothetical protein